jgi:hypothetical protein
LIGLVVPHVMRHDAVMVGMATSIIGMACRYKAHLDELKELKGTEAKVDVRR